ncbi:MAG: branched-chain amino acid ABC transporter permease [Microthrixaceae bacterium]|nr:branched-chain amino acid ABC transporter permease [Microthrixaceae bacterium]
MDWNLILTSVFSAIFIKETIFYVLGAQGLNIHYGYTGLMNFGQAGFMAVGAYGMAISVESGGLSLWLGIVVGILWAVVLALLLGLPALRLRGDYLAIVTIAAAEIVRLVVRSESMENVSGGNSGINDFADAFYDLNPWVNGRRYEFGPFSYSGQDLWVQAVGWGVVLAMVLLTFLLMRSPWGRVLKAIRENEDAVRSLGKTVYAYKIQSLVLGGVMGALGGIVLAIGNQSVQPDTFATRTTFICYGALILGGAARVWGPVLGGILFYMVFRGLDVMIRQMERNDVIPESIMSSTQSGVVRFVFLGAALMLLMVFRPQGILGDRRELAFDG